MTGPGCGDGGSEHITSARHIDDEGLSGILTNKKPPQAGDLNPQVRVVDARLGPSPGEKLLVGHHHTRMLDQGHEDVERPSAQRNEFLSLGKHPRSWPQVILAEGQYEFAAPEILTFVPALL